tara:strand:+ start:1250 stop:1387 length:138 start_codon:yes stop_codon:yes gene_type:complete
MLRFFPSTKLQPPFARCSAKQAPWQSRGDEHIEGDGLAPLANGFF